MSTNNLYCNNCKNFNKLKTNIFVKLFSFVLGLLFILINDNVIFLIVYALLLLLIFKISGYKLINIFKYIKDIWFINIIIILISLATLDVFKILYIFISFQIIFTYNYYIYTTTKIIELRKVFIIIFKPLKKLKINYYKVAEDFVNLNSFLPKFVDSVKSVIIKQKSRGVDIYSVNLKTKIIAYFTMISKGLSLTQKKLEKQRVIRKFMLYNERKYSKLEYKKINFIDIMFIIIHILIFILIINKEGIYYEMPFMYEL